MDKITYLYTIYDRLAEQYGPIYEAVNDEVAFRQFNQVIHNLPEISKNDYQLIKVGLFDRSDLSLVKNPDDIILLTRKGASNE